MNYKKDTKVLNNLNEYKLTNNKFLNVFSSFLSVNECNHLDMKIFLDIFVFHSKSQSVQAL